MLVAEESAGIQVLRGMTARGYDLVAVLTSDGEATQGATVRDVSATLGVPVMPAELVREAKFSTWITEHNVDILLNVHSLFIAHADVVAAARIGSYNLHPGPLPEYAGLNAPSWAIYFGEATHGVTLHRMEPEIDTGPIAYDTRFDIEENDTGLSLSARCVRHGVPLVTKLLDSAARDPSSIPALPQDLSRRRYFGLEVPQEGQLDWSRPGKDIVDFVRASDYSPLPSPWGHPRTELNGRELRIVKTSGTGLASESAPGTVGEPEGEAMPVSAADEWVLVRRLEIEGRYVKPAGILEPGDRLTSG